MAENSKEAAQADLFLEVLPEDYLVGDMLIELAQYLVEKGYSVHTKALGKEKASWIYVDSGDILFSVQQLSGEIDIIGVPKANYDVKTKYKFLQRGIKGVGVAKSSSEWILGHPMDFDDDVCHYGTFQDFVGDLLEMGFEKLSFLKFKKKTAKD